MAQEIEHKRQPELLWNARSARLLSASLTALGLLALPLTAAAQTNNNQVSGKTSPGLALNMNGSPSGYVGLSPSLSGALIDLPVESVGSALFDLDISDTGCMTGASNCVRRDETIDVGYYKSVKNFSVKGLDLQLAPKAAVRFNDESSSAVVGAIVKIGEDLREGSEFDSNTWYVFAGADAEAVTYAPNGVSRLTSGQFYLQDRIIVGDAQAGLGYRIGDADISVGYFRREVSSFGNNDPSDDFSKTEDAAALSFTWRR